ncbi:MAG: hypothetical protein AAF203_09580 [Pseudomonadota bacterium]
MKLLICLMTALFSMSVWAKPVDGELFYKKKNGELVKRDVTLEVPSRGQGEVVLSGKNFEWRTKDFWTTQEKGQTLFTAAFKTEFMGFKSVIAFQGTYLQGTNEIIYDGNFFKRDGDEAANGDISDFEYNGGFRFSFER